MPKVPAANCHARLGGVARLRKLADAGDPEGRSRPRTTAQSHGGPVLLNPIKVSASFLGKNPFADIAQILTAFRFAQQCRRGLRPFDHFLEGA